MTDFLKEGNVVKGGVNETTSIVDRLPPPTPTKPKTIDYAASYKLHATIREAALREAAWCFDDDVGHPSKARAAILALIKGETK
jgi:hypothetical protein